MISNRISTLNKDFFHTARYKQKNTDNKQGTNIAIVKIRKEHRTIQDRQHNDGKQRECDISLIYQRCPLEDWDQTQWFLMQQCLCPTFCPYRFCPHSCAGTCLYCRGSQHSWFPLCLHECLADLVRYQNRKSHSEVQYWFLCKTQVMSNLRGATNPKYIRFIHWMPLGHIWENLQMTTYNLDPAWIFVMKTEIQHLVDGSSTLHQDKMSIRTQRQWLCCCDLDSWLR